MRKSFVALAGTLALAFATTANAAVVIASVTPGTDPYSGPAPTYDFDSSTPSTGGGGVVTGSASGSFAQPFGSTGNYYSVGPSTSTPGTIDLSSFGDIFSLSLLWGSVDAYNTLTFLDSSNNILASFTGSDIFDPANGDQTDPNTNPVVTFLLTGGDVGAFSTMQLSSATNAFEIDDVTVNGAVPEPATWAMLLLGFLGIGFAMRRKTSSGIAQYA